MRDDAKTGESRRRDLRGLGSDKKGNNAAYAAKKPPRIMLSDAELRVVERFQGSVSFEGFFETGSGRRASLRPVGKAAGEVEWVGKHRSMAERGVCGPCGRHTVAEATSEGSLPG